MNTNIPELGGFDTGLVLDNLAVIFGRQEPWLTATIAQISELADAILKDAENDPDTLYSILLSLLGYMGEDFPHSHHSDGQHIYGMEKCLGVYQKLLLYHFLFQKAGNYGGMTSHTQRDIPSSAKGKIAYLKSALASKAYIRFASVIEGCKATDAHSFVDACEEVQNGLCEYCILPLRTSTDGQLMSFYRLIIKYRLQIVAVYDVHHKTGGHPATTTFGLLRNMGDGWDIQDLLDNPFLQQSTPLTLSLLYTSEKRNTFGDILVASECSGVPLIETSTMPFGEVSTLLYGHLPDQDTPTPPNVFVLSFDMGEQLLTPYSSESTMPQAFLMHLMIEASEHLVLGLYPKL